MINTFPRGGLIKYVYCYQMITYSYSWMGGLPSYFTVMGLQFMMFNMLFCAEVFNILFSTPLKLPSQLLHQFVIPRIHFNKPQRIFLNLLPSVDVGGEYET